MRTYSNPIIYADVPDLDIIRSKDKQGRQAFYMVSTTMHLSPGVPVMKSYDLVNWTIVNYVYDTLEEDDRFALKNGQNDYSRGSWAASLRQDRETGWFFVAFTCNSTGKTYMFMTDDIENGPWYRTTFPEMCYDNGMFFDDDNKKYIFFSEDCGDGINTHDIFYRELFADVEKHSVEFGPKQFVLHNSNYETPKEGLWGEGYHVYKHNGYYYLFAIQFQQWQRQELCWRSSDIKGTGRWDDKKAGAWECKKVFCGHLFDENGNAFMKNNGIAQGGIVDTEDGKWYCFIFQDTGAVGRIPMLSPMVWGTEGEMKDWPVIGEYLGTSEKYLFNRMPVRAEIPVEAEMPASTEASLEADSPKGLIQWDDDFINDKRNYRVFDRPERKKSSYLNLFWQWNHNPDNTRWTLTERESWLRLYPVGTSKNIRTARNTLTARTFGPACSGKILMDVSAITDGMTAGFVAFQRQYGFVGVRMENGEKFIIMQKADSKEDADGRCTEKISLGQEKEIWFRIDCDFRDFKDESTFFYSLDNLEWNQIGEKVYMKYDMPDFMGYRFGIFAFSENETDGFVDVDKFAICIH